MQDDHELCVAWPPQQSMVWARKVNHLEVNELLSEAGGIPNHDEKLNAPEGDNLDHVNDPKEGSSLRI